MFHYKDVVQSVGFGIFFFFYSILALIALGCSDDKEGVKIFKY